MFAAVVPVHQPLRVTGLTTRLTSHEPPFASGRTDTVNRPPTASAFMSITSWISPCWTPRTTSGGVHGHLGQRTRADPDGGRTERRERRPDLKPQLRQRPDDHVDHRLLVAAARHPHAVREIRPDPQGPLFPFLDRAAEVTCEQRHDVGVVEPRRDLVRQARPAHSPLVAGTTASDHTLLLQRPQVEPCGGDVDLQGVGDLLGVDGTVGAPHDLEYALALPARRAV